MLGRQIILFPRHACVLMSLDKQISQCQNLFDVSIFTKPRGDRALFSKLRAIRAGIAAPLLPEEGICCFSLICTSIGCYGVFTSGRQNLYAELRNLFHVAAQVFESLALWMRVLGMKRKLVREVIELQKDGGI